MVGVGVNGQNHIPTKPPEEGFCVEMPFDYIPRMKARVLGPK